jgi:hypothetical protein
MPLGSTRTCDIRGQEDAAYQFRLGWLPSIAQALFEKLQLPLFHLCSGLNTSQPDHDDHCDLAAGASHVVGTRNDPRNTSIVKRKAISGKERRGFEGLSPSGVGPHASGQRERRKLSLLVVRLCRSRRPPEPMGPLCAWRSVASNPGRCAPRKSSHASCAIPAPYRTSAIAGWSTAGGVCRPRHWRRIFFGGD